MRWINWSVVLAVLVAAVLASGCGGSGDGDSTTASLSKEQFVQKANFICRQADNERKNQVQKFLAANGSGKATQEKAILEIALPSVQKQLEELKALEAPSGDEEKVNALWAEIEEGIEGVEKDPLGSVENYIFTDYDKAASKYGIEECANL